MREKIKDKVPTPEIAAAGAAQGMESLLALGVKHAEAGVTSLEEVLRIVG